MLFFLQLCAIRDELDCVYVCVYVRVSLFLSLFFLFLGTGGGGGGGGFGDGGLQEGVWERVVVREGVLWSGWRCSGGGVGEGGGERRAVVGPE